MLTVCVAGATGWTGQPIAQAIIDADDLTLRSAVARSVAGVDLGTAWGVDALVDYTSHHAVKANGLLAVRRGVHVVIGASGLTADDLAEIDAAARDHRVGVVAGANFSLTAAMAQAAALLVARHLPQWEIIDYASATKPDVPSGTAQDLAERLAQVRRPYQSRPLDQLAGLRQARGATVAGAQVHSVRLFSFVVSTEVVFGLPDED